MAKTGRVGSKVNAKEEGSEQKRSHNKGIEKDTGVSIRTGKPEIDEKVRRRSQTRERTAMRDQPRKDK